MKKHLWFLAGMTVLLAGCFGSGGGGGDGGGGPSMAEGPKASYLLYSAFDGTDYELYLLNPNLPPPAAEGAPAPDPQAPQIEIIKLTDNDTADVEAVAAGTNLFWQCDDGAGSEFCMMDMFVRGFSQLTTIAGGGALGRTVDPVPFVLGENGAVVGMTSPQGRSGNPANGILRYNSAEKLLVMKSLAEITGVNDEFSEQSLGGSETFVKGGNVFFSASFSSLAEGDRPNYVWEDGSYMMNPAGEIKKLEKNYRLWNYKDSVLALDRIGNVFGFIDQSTAGFNQVKSFETAFRFGPCSSLSSVFEQSGPRTIFALEEAPETGPEEMGAPSGGTYKLYAYLDSTKEMKLLKEAGVEESWLFGCFQSDDGAKALVSVPAEGGVFTYTIFDIDAGAGTEVYTSLENERFISANENLSVMAFLSMDGFDPMMEVTGNKLIFINAADRSKVEVEASVRRGSFFKGGRKFVFESSGGDAFIYDLDQKKLTALPMPLYPNADQSDHDKFLFLRRQSCPIENCDVFDRRASTSFKIYKLAGDIAVDVPNNGRDILFPTKIELTAEQYKKFKDAAADANFIKSARPTADTAGPVLTVSRRFVELSPEWFSSSAATAFSRQPGASFTWTRVQGGVESPLASETPTLSDTLNDAIGLYPAFSVGSIDFGTPAVGSGVLVVKVSDGAGVAEERIGYYMSPPEPPEPPCGEEGAACPPDPCEAEGTCPPGVSHPPTITAVTTIAGTAIEGGGTWVCSLSASTMRESDLAAAAAHNAAVVAREVAAIGDSVIPLINAITAVMGVAREGDRTALDSARDKIRNFAGSAMSSADRADAAAIVAISPSVTAEQIANANALAVAARLATERLGRVVAGASTRATAVAGSTDNETIDANAANIAELASSANAAIARGNVVTNILPGCAVSVNVSDTGRDILEPFVEGLAGGVTGWMVEGTTGSGTITFTVQRPADGTGLPAPIGEARITARDERGDEAVFRLNLSMTY